MTQPTNVAIDMSISARCLIAGEDAEVSFTIENLGADPITVRDPALDSEQPRLEVRDARGETVFARGPVPPAWGGRAPEEVTLAAGERASGTRSLTRWIPKLAPGPYSLVASIDAQGQLVQTEPLHFEIAPLQARSVAFMGPHAGHGTLRYALVQHRSGDESVLFLMLHDFDAHEGTLDQSMCVRLSEDPCSAAPVPSVTRNGEAFEGQWVSCIESTRLRGFYHVQTERRASVDLPITKGRSAIGPALIDLSGWDESAPPSAELFVFEAGYGEVLAISAAGTLHARVSFLLGPGELEWGASTFRRNGQREVFLALHHEGQLRLDRVWWSGDLTSCSSETVAELGGRVLGGALTSTDDDDVLGALIVRAEREDEIPALYSLVRFSVSGDGVARASGAPIASAEKIDFVRAHVDVGSDGEVVALLHAVGGRWHVVRESTAIPLADDAFGDRDPVACFRGPKSFVVLAGPTGLEYIPL
jgi:hypothetical protein